MDKSNLFSIVIVTHKRSQKHAEIIYELLSSLTQLKGQSAPLSVFVVINEESENHCKALMENFPSIQFICGQFSTPGLARNKALEQVTSPWTLFLDDDVLIPAQYFEVASKIISEASEKLVCFGGPDQPPPKADIFQEALGKTLMSPMATAHTRLRHSSSKKVIKKGLESNLILCHLWVRTNFLKEKGINFSPYLFRNEENLLVSEITSKGGEGLYSSELHVHHYRKTNLYQLFKAVFSSGQNRVKSFLLDKKLLNGLFFVPAGFVLYLFSLSFSHHFQGIFIPLQIYFTLSLFMAMKLAATNFYLIPLILFYQFFLNIVYGLGILLGLFRLPFWYFRI